MIWTNMHDYILLGVDTIMVGIFYSMFRRRDRIIRNILDAPSVTVGPDLSDLVGESSDYTSLPYVVVRGRVQEMGQSIESSSGLRGVLQVVTMNEHSYRRHAFGHWYVAGVGTWGDTVRTLHQSQNSVPFTLKNLSKESTCLVEVENPFDAVPENLLLTVSTNFTPSNASVASTVVGFFTGVAVKGIERTEEFLPVDTILTGIGQIVKDPNGRIKLVSPLDDDKYPYMLSTLPVETIVKKLENRNTWFKVATLFFLTVGIYISVRRAKRWWKERERVRMRQKILDQRSKIDLHELSDNQICIVCLTNPREVILLNCGHVCVCADCCLKISHKCPICRNVVLGTHAAFIS